MRRQRGRPAGRRAQRIGHDRDVTAGVAGMNIRNRQHRCGAAADAITIGQWHAVEEPLAAERGTGRSDGEGGVAAQQDRLAGRLPDDLNRGIDGERGQGTGGCAIVVGDNNLIRGTVVRLCAGDGQGRRGCSTEPSTVGQRNTVGIPEIIQRSGTVCGYAETGVGAGQYIQIRRLAADEAGTRTVNVAAVLVAVP